MKKVSKNPRVNDLMIDVIDYTFTEWLVRQGLFTAFKTNFESTFSPRVVFRDRLRSLIRYTLRHSTLGPADLIDSAFLFSSAPEGFVFWSKESADWKRFCDRFQAKF